MILNIRRWIFLLRFFVVYIIIFLMRNVDAISKDSKRSKIKLSSDTNDRDSNVYGW